MVQYNAWFSLALEYGLSILSLGKAGQGDDQLLTGGLTAVETLLGSEIGITQKEGFVVDHGSSHMERFPLNQGDNLLFAQFLIQTLGGEKVEQSYNDLAKMFSTELGNGILKSSIFDEVKDAPQILSIKKVNKIILTAHENTHNKMKININNNAIISIIKDIILSSFVNFGFSETLDSLSNKEIETVNDYLMPNREILLQNMNIDIQGKIIQEYPLVFLLTQPKYFKNEIEDLITRELEFNRHEQTNNRIFDIIEEIFADDSLRNLIQKFDVTTLRQDRENISDLIEHLIRERLLHKAPIVFLLNTEINLKPIIQEKVIDRVLTEFDLGEVLSKIAFTLIQKAHPEDELQAKLVLNFFLNLSQIFPGGLPKQLWIIITNLLQIYAVEARQDLLQVNKIMEIEDYFWSTISENIKSYQSFHIGNFDMADSGHELINLFNGVREAIGRSFHAFYTEFIWNISTETFGTYISSLQQSIMSAYQALQTMFYFVKFMNMLASKKLQFIDPIQLGFNFNEFMKFTKPQVTSSRAIAIQNMGEMNPDNIVTYYSKKFEDVISNEKTNVSRWFSKINTNVQDLEKFLQSAEKADSIKNLRLPSIILSKPENFTYAKDILANYDRDIKVITDSFGSIDELFSKAKSELEGESDSKKINKRISKFVDEANKILSKAKDKIPDPTKILNQLDGYKQSMQSELDKVNKEIPKIIEKEKVKSIRLEVDSLGNLKSVDLERIKNLIIKEENKRFKGDSFISDSEFLFAYCTTFLFDSLTVDMTNKAIDLAIFNPKSSRLISSVIDEGRLKRSNGNKGDFDFFESLKKEIIKTGDSVLAITQLISSAIHKEISTDTFPLKTFVAEKDEVLAVEIGALDKSYEKWLENNIQIHPRVNLLKDSNSIMVYLEVGRRPATGIAEVQYLMDAIALQTYNNELVRLGMFIESLKIVASTLGEHERRKVQHLFDSLAQFLTTI